MIWGTGLSLFNGALKSQLGINEDKIAIILMGYNIAIICGQIPLGKLIDKIGTKRSIIIAEALGVLFFLVTLISAFSHGSIQLWMLFAGQCIYGVVLAFYIPAKLIIFTNVKKERAAETFGIGFFMTGIGMFPAAMIAGLLIEKIHFIAPLIVGMIFIPVNLFILLKNFKDPDFITKTVKSEKIEKIREIAEKEKTEKTETSETENY